MMQSERWSWMKFGWASLGWTWLAAAAIGVWQCYHYLRIGSWFPLSLISVLRWCGVAWALAPSDWIGIYKILDFVPLSSFLLFIGVAAVGLSEPLDALADRRNARELRAAIERERIRKRRLGYDDEANGD